MRDSWSSLGGLERLAETRRALTRATLIFGSVAVVFALAIGTPGERGTRIAGFDEFGVDPMTTASVSNGERFTVRRSVLQAPGSGPCLYFPDGTQRGAC